MAYFSATPKNHSYLGDSVLPVQRCTEPFKVGRFVKPINRHTLTVNIAENVSIEITLQPTQHWKVKDYNKGSDVVTLIFKSTKIAIPMTHAEQMFKDYDQTVDGKVLYKVHCGGV